VRMRGEWNWLRVMSSDRLCVLVCTVKRLRTDQRLGTKDSTTVLFPMFYIILPNDIIVGGA